MKPTAQDPGSPAAEPGCVKRAPPRVAGAAGETSLAELIGGIEAVLWEGRVIAGGGAAEPGGVPWVYTYVSPPAGRVLGYEPGCWLADAAFWARCIHPEDRDRVLSCYRTAAARGGAFHTDYRALKRDGEVICLREVGRGEGPEEGGERLLRGLLLEVGDWRRTEEALRDAEERYRDLVENINECVFAVDDSGRLTYISPVIEQISGYRPAEVLNRHFSDFIDPRDLASVGESFARTIAGAPEPFEYRVVAKWGEVRWVRSSSRLIVSGDRIAGVRGAIVDITDRKHAEQALAESRARYQDLFESANDLIYSFDVSGNLTGVNAAVEELTGYSRDELLRMNLAQLTPPEEWEFARRMIERKIAGQRTRYETTLLTKGGRRVPVEVNSRAIAREGRPVEIQGIARDLREEKRTQRLARERNSLENEAKLAGALARAGRELMSCRHPDELLQRLCRVTADLLGCDCSYTLCRDPEDQAYVAAAGWGDTPEQAEALKVVRIPPAVLNRLIARLESEEVVQVLLDEPQDLLPQAFPARFGITAALFTVLRRGGEVLGIHSGCYRGACDPFTAEQVEIARGVAQLASLALENARLVEQLERANRLKADFLATMSHELRTPLNVIIGYNQMLLEEGVGPLNAEQNDTAARVGKSARELLSLIDATLAVTRLDADPRPVKLSEIDPGMFLRDIESAGRELYERPEVEVVWRVSGDLPRIRTDPVKLRVVLNNLIENAIKFTPRGRVEVGARDRDGNVEITVSDTGVGIAEEDHDAVFEPFFGEEKDASVAGAGVGLGLYIVRRLLELLGGSVTLESRVGHGSTFRVHLPPDPHVQRPLQMGR